MKLTPRPHFALRGARQRSRRGPRLRGALGLVALVGLGSTAWALGEAPLVDGKPTSGSVGLVTSSGAAPILVDASDHAGVRRAARDLQQDVERVTQVRPDLVDIQPTRARSVIVVGTAGPEPAHRRARPAPARLDVREVHGRWEAFGHPDRGAPLAGRRAGPRHRRQRQARHDLRRSTTSPSRSASRPGTGGPTCRCASATRSSSAPGVTCARRPAVKYRGIFINDEAPALTGWATEKFGGFEQQVLRQGLRADPAPAGQLPLARDVGQGLRRRRSRRTRDSPTSTASSWAPRTTSR